MIASAVPSGNDAQNPTPIPIGGEFVVPPLPIPMTSFIGRDREVGILTSMLADPQTRLVTLTGPGGTGKTRLALAVARQSPPAAFVSLETETDPALIGEAIESQLGIESRVGRSAVENLAQAIGSHELTVVLDNLEHVVEGTPIIVSLLAACPALTVLATSRVRLGLSGERIYPVDPLAVPGERASLSVDEASTVPAIRLFVERAAATQPTFALDTRNIDAVSIICRQLDGLPLAIELAAARSDMLSPQSLAARLEHRLDILTDGPRDVPQRLRTMRAAIEWSYDLLPEADQVYWEQLAAFVNGFTADAAIAVAGGSGPGAGNPLETLDVLLGQGLIRSTSNGAGEPRFALLQTTRELALERLATREGMDEARDRHAAWYGALAREAEPYLMSNDPDLWVERLEADLPNLREAMSWNASQGRVDAALQTAISLAWFWTIPRYLEEGLQWYQRLLGGNDTDVQPATRARAQISAGDLAHWLVRNDVAIRMHREALEFWRSSGDIVQVASVLRSLGSESLDLVQFELAAGYLAEARDLARKAGDAWNLAAATNLLGFACAELGRLEESIRFHTEALRGWQRSGHQDHFPMALNGLAAAWLESGDLVRALESYESVLTFTDADEVDEHSMAILGIARIAARSGQVNLAVKLLAASVTLRNRLGNPCRPHTIQKIEVFEAELRSRVGLAPFNALWREGVHMDFAQADAAARSLQLPATGSDEQLTPREHEVLVLLVEGATDHDIADRLFITRRTTSKHVASILAKLDAANRTAAATIAIRRGLV